jgi:hypothetical protein
MAETFMTFSRSCHFNLGNGGGAGGGGTVGNLELARRASMAQEVCGPDGWKCQPSALDGSRLKT